MKVWHKHTNLTSPNNASGTQLDNLTLVNHESKQIVIGIDLFSTRYWFDTYILFTTGAY